MTRQINLTLGQLRELLHYDRRSGAFTWKKKRNHRVQAGDRAGSLATRGYWQISIAGTVIQAHRLAWFYMKGTWPPDEIDHLNGNPLDNRWSNLRLADSTINKHNRRKANRNNKLGLLGVGLRDKRYRVRIMVNRREISLGRFSTPKEAHAAYVSAKRRLHEGCTI